MPVSWGPADPTVNSRFHDWLGQSFTYTDGDVWVFVSTFRYGDGTWGIRMRQDEVEGKEGDLWKLTADEFLRLIESGELSEA